MPIKFIYYTKLGQLEYRTKIQNNIDSCRNGQNATEWDLTEINAKFLTQKIYTKWTNIGGEILAW